MNNTVDMKDYMNEDVFDILSSFVANVDQRIVSNMYVGTVVEHDTYEDSSPLAGKCKIMVYGIYDNVPTANLPWALPDQTWVGSQIGSFVVPPVGTLVRVYFEHDNPYKPTYSSKLLQAGKVSPLIQKNYPNNMVMWTTDSGSSLQHDRTTGEEIKTNMIGQYTPEQITITSNNDGKTAVIVSEPAVLPTEGSIVETIYGAAETIGDSFYNKSMEITGSSTTDKLNIAMDGTLKFDHVIGSHEVHLEISAGGELKVTTTLGGSTHTLVMNSAGIEVVDHFKNTIKTTSDGVLVESPNSKLDLHCPQTVNLLGDTTVNVEGQTINVRAKAALNLKSVLGMTTIEQGVMASPTAGLPCALPFCLFNGMKHDTKVM